MSLVYELAVATGMVSLCVAIHLCGIAALLILLRRHRQARPDRRLLIHEALAILGASTCLFVLHGIEIWLYAALYRAFDALGDIETALYFSTASYTTVGYGDVVLPRGWRVIGAIESANGILLLGWSTAFFVAIVSRIRWLEDEAREIGKPR